MTLDVGDIIERKYRIERVLGQGGMGTVYEGSHLRIRRRVAIKVLRALVAQEPHMIERFEREALAASSIQARQVVEIYDVGQLDSGEHYMIMEYLEGESLQARFRRKKRLEVEQLFPIAVEILTGMAAAHSAGIIHRDLKPANIFLPRDGETEQVKILDFGISKFSQLGSDSFTQTGAIVGTPHYMAPEQTRGPRHVDPRSDLYSIGAMLFRGLIGHAPLRAETIHELIAKLISQPAPKVCACDPSVDGEAAAIIDQALMREPDQRFQTAEEMKAACKQWLASKASGRVAARPAAPAADEQEGKTEIWQTPTSLDRSGALLAAPSQPSAQPMPFPQFQATPASQAPLTPVSQAPLTPVSQATGQPSSADVTTPYDSTSGPPTAPSDLLNPDVTTPYDSASQGPTTSPSLADRIPLAVNTDALEEPTTLLTPSPSAIDPAELLMKPRRVPLGAVVAGAGVLVVVIVIASVWLGGGETTGPAAAPAPTDSDGANRVEVRSATSASASASATASASASASVSASVSAKSTAKPKPTPLPIRRPVPQPPPKVDRDIREDI